MSPDFGEPVFLRTGCDGNLPAALKYIGSKQFSRDLGDIIDVSLYIGIWDSLRSGFSNILWFSLPRYT